jgi:hypothetical protein
MANKEGYRGDAKYAQGGASTGRSKDFLKTEDRFAGRQFKAGGGRNDEEWGKGSSKANPEAKDKSLKAIKPRK